MVHFKLTAAAAAILAPTVMGATPVCATTDKFVVQRCDFGASATCLASEGLGCVNFVSGVCTYIAANQYLKMTAVTTGGVVTFSEFTDSACGTPATGAPATVTRKTYATALATGDCISTTTAATAATATILTSDAMYGETAANEYGYQIFCAADTTALSQSAAVIVYTALDSMDCSTAPSTAITDAAALPVVASTAAAGFCTRTAAATSTRTKCTTAGAFEVEYYATKDCGVASSGAPIATATAAVSGTYQFPTAGSCNNGCAWAGDADCYTGLTATQKAVASGSNVIVKKSGTTQCTSLTNVAPAPAPAASPAGIASAALAAVVGLGYLFF